MKRKQWMINKQHNDNNNNNNGTTHKKKCVIFLIICFFPCFHFGSLYSSSKSFSTQLTDELFSDDNRECTVTIPTVVLDATP